MADLYAPGKQCGTDSFGHQLFRTTRRTDGRTFVAKFYPASQDPMRMENELELARLCAGDHVVGMQAEVLDVLDPVHGTASRMLVREECEHGELFEFIVRHGAVEEDVGKVIVKQILLGVDHCHRQGVFHRDIKPETLQLAEDGDSTIVKLTDFQLAGRGDDDAQKQRRCVGTAAYMSPQALRGEACDWYKNDAWAVAVTAFIVLVGGPPFVQPTAMPEEGGAAKEVKHCPYYACVERGRWDRFWRGHGAAAATLSAAGRAFIQRGLCADEQARATVGELLLDPWLAGVDERDPRLSALVMDTVLRCTFGTPGKAGRL